MILVAADVKDIISRVFLTNLIQEETNPGKTNRYGEVTGQNSRAH